MPVLPPVLTGKLKMTVPIKSPDQISNLVLWLDANSGVFDATSGGNLVTSDNGDIYRWEDRSPNAYHVTQATQSRTPKLRTNFLNSKNVVQYTSSAQILESTAFSQGLTTMTNFCVAYSNSAGGGSLGRIFEIGNNTAASSTRLNGFNTSTSKFRTFVGNSIGQEVAWVNSQWNIYSNSWNGGNSGATSMTSKFNRRITTAPANTAGASTSASSGKLQIGNRNNVSSYDRQWDGYIAEIIIYGAALGVNDVYAVENYLAEKWGL